MYQRAGMMHDTPCRIPGMFSMGKTIPESMMTGSMSSMAEISRAVDCRSERVEIKSPSARASIR